MAKRNRGGRRQPARASGRPRPSAADARPVSPRVQSQLAAATEIAEDVLEGRPASAAGELRSVRSSTAARSRAKPSALLAARAATEYVYVAQDLRRIAKVGGSLFGVMLLLWVLVVVVKVV